MTALQYINLLFPRGKWKHFTICNHTYLKAPLAFDTAKHNLSLTVPNTTCLWHRKTQLVFDTAKHNLSLTLQNTSRGNWANPICCLWQSLVQSHLRCLLSQNERRHCTKLKNYPWRRATILTGYLVDSVRFDNRATCGTPSCDVLRNLTHAWRGGSTCWQFWCSIPIVPRLLNIPFRWKVGNDSFWFKKCHYLSRDVGEDLANLQDTMGECKSYLMVKWKVKEW